MGSYLNKKDLVLFGTEVRKVKFYVFEDGIWKSIGVQHENGLWKKWNQHNCGSFPLMENCYTRTYNNTCDISVTGAHDCVQLATT